MAKVTKKKVATKPAKKVVKTAKPAPKKVASKKPAAKAPAKKTAVKPAPKPSKAKAPAKKTTVNKVAPKPVKKAIAKAKPIAKKATPKKVAAKKVTPKKVVAKAKPVTKKAVTKPVKKAAVKPVVKPTAKPVVKAKPVKAEKPVKQAIVKTEPKKIATTPAARPAQKTAMEKAHEIAAQRHIHEQKPLMQSSVIRYKDADLELFKSVILKKIAKAKEEIDFYTDQIKNTSESETQFASIDDGSMTAERENMNQIVVRMQKLIFHLESALVRIENKSYGICRETGKLIPKERLLVVPHATLSVEGKKMEKK